MGGGNGAKAATKRARNMKDAGPKANSILKDKEKMMNIVCSICRVRACVLAWGWGWVGFGAHQEESRLIFFGE